MDWLTQNGLWIVLGIGAVFLFRRSGMFGDRHHRRHSYDDGDVVEDASRPTEATSAKDPVTGAQIPTAQAMTSVYRGRVYYFETPESRQRFEASPGQFAAESGQPSPTDDRANGHRRRRHGGC